MENVHSEKHQVTNVVSSENIYVIYIYDCINYITLYYVLNVPYLECYFGGITSLFDRPMRLWIKRLVPFCSSSKMVIACHVISGFTSHGMVAQTLIASYPPLFLRKKTSKFTPCGLIQRISGFVQRLGIQ